MTTTNIKIKPCIFMFLMLSLFIMNAKTEGFETKNNTNNEPLESVIDQNFNATLRNYKENSITWSTEFNNTKNFVAEDGFDGIEYGINKTSIVYNDYTNNYGDNSYQPYIGVLSNTTAGTEHNYTLGSIFKYNHTSTIKEFILYGAGNDSTTWVYFSLYNATLSGSDIVKDQLIYKSENKSISTSSSYITYNSDIILNVDNTYDKNFVVEVNTNDTIYEFYWSNGTIDYENQLCYIYNDTINELIDYYFRFDIKMAIPIINPELNTIHTGTTNSRYYYRLFTSINITKDSLLRNFSFYSTLSYSTISVELWEAYWNPYISVGTTDGVWAPKPGGMLKVLGTFSTTGTSLRTLYCNEVLDASMNDGFYFIGISGSWGHYWYYDNDPYQQFGKAYCFSNDGFNQYSYDDVDFWCQYGTSDVIDLTTMDPYFNVNGTNYELNDNLSINELNFRDLQIALIFRWPSITLNVKEYYSIIDNTFMDITNILKIHDWQYDKLETLCYFTLKFLTTYTSYQIILRFPIEYTGFMYFSCHGSTNMVSGSYSYEQLSYNKLIVSMSAIPSCSNEFDLRIYKYIETTRNEDFKYMYNELDNNNEVFIPIEFSLFYMLSIPAIIGLIMVLIFIPAKNYQKITDTIGV